MSNETKIYKLRLFKNLEDKPEMDSGTEKKTNTETVYSGPSIKRRQNFVQ